MQNEVQGAGRWRRGWSWPLLVIVIGAPAAASWHGLTDAGEHALGLHGAWSWLVPLVVDAAASYAAVLALRSTESGDAAGLDRALVWLYAAGSAALNAWWADRSGGLPAAAFFAGSSVSAVVLWDRTLRAVRREVLRARGAVAAPTPRFRAARWLVAFHETKQAWCLAVVEGITDPAEAVRAVRHQPRTDHAPVPALAELSKADAVRAALAEVDDQTPRVVAAWLAQRGIEVAPTYVADVQRRDASKQITTSGGDAGDIDSGPLRLAG
ncbi:MAG: DUF2637 domain-containing protein [Actinomycetes bacterium]